MDVLLLRLPCKSFSSSSRLILFCFFLLLLVPSSSPSSSVRSPKLFRVDLDLPPRNRWLHVLDAFKDSDLIPRLAHNFRSYLPGPTRPPVFWMISQLTRLIPHEFAEELRGMADHLHDRGIGLGELVLLNVFYDLFDFALPDPFLSELLGLTTANSTHPAAGRPLGCTSILTADRQGRILHGRNLDYVWTDLLREATILVDFVRKGKVQFTGVQFLLFNGILTGQRPNAFTLSLNARYSGGPWDNVLMELFTRFRHPVGYEVRKVLDTVTDYPGAVQTLSQVPMIAPAYLIVGGSGPGDGAIITRDRLGPADVFFLDYLHHRWFLAETNDDPWKAASADKRRKHAQKCLRQIGQHRISPDALCWQVLASPPVRNSLTVFTAVMSTDRPELIYNSTFVWEKQNNTNSP